ncbi:Hypothetical predicted protein [Pelobates cultripes]|uniref:Uncharacterized protein n=1 Tax=Pelobates cultripes TaxID=61616 RepID=A0AAD1W052_PELCU|nr:Hypothetical predicted protein [Pelobates cultripes]
MVPSSLTCQPHGAQSQDSLRVQCAQVIAQSQSKLQHMCLPSTELMRKVWKLDGPAPTRPCGCGVKLMLGVAPLNRKVTPNTHTTGAVISRADAQVGWGVEAEDLAQRTEPAGGIQHVGPPNSYSGVPAVGNGKRSEDRFPAATNRRKVKGAKPPRKGRGREGKRKPPQTREKKRSPDRGAQSRKMQKSHKRKYIPTAKK